jgi:hypothetical protein
MSSRTRSLIDPLKSRLKRRLAGQDVEALVERRARKRLRWIAQDSSDPVLQFRALRNLAELLDPEAVPLFVAIADAEAGSIATAQVRTAAEGLGRLLNGDTAVVLRRLLDRHRPGSTQLAAARGLATIGRAEDWQAVRDWSLRADEEAPLFPDRRDCTATNGEHPPGTQPLVWVLKWLASSDSKPRMDADRGADKIVAAAHRNALERKDLNDSDFERIVLHLGCLARDRDFDLLVDLLRNQDSEDRRWLVIQAIGIHGDPRAIPMFVQWLEEVGNDQPTLAADLLRAAGRLGWPELSAPSLRLWERFQEEEVRLNVLCALGECGGDDAVRFLLERVRSREENLTPLEFEWTARALRRCGVIGREAIRGAVAMARAGGGERERVTRLASLAGIH